jgi:hypothetical protein
VAEDSVDALRQSYEVSRRQMQAIMEQQGRLRDAAEAFALNTREALERVAEALCPGLVDGYCKASPEGLSRIQSSDLADAVIQDAKQRLLLVDAAAVAGESVSESYQDLSAKAATLEQQVADLTAQLDEALQARDKAQTRRALVEAQLGQAHQRLGDKRTAVALPGVAAERDEQGAGEVPEERLPEWVRAWREKGMADGSYERDCDLLRLLAETGMVRRPKVSRTLAEMWGVTSRSGGVQRLFTRCERLGLVALEDARSETSGAGREQLVFLTENGTDTCRLLLGIVPVESLYHRLMRRHKSPEHSLLNLEAADLLRDAGYAVDLFPASATAPSGAQFAPDLGASLNGRALFIEVERLARKSEKGWARKWEIVYEATNGEIYVVVANKTALDSIRSGILYSVGNRPLALRMTSVSDARHRGLKGHDVWIERRGVQ